MPLFKVEFKHSEVTTYQGYVEADSQEQAISIAEENPFDIEDLEEQEVQGIDCFDFEILNEEEK